MKLKFQNQEFNNWSEYFHWLFKKDNLFRPSEIEQINMTTIETYRYRSSERKTKIIVAYLDDYSKLIYYYVVNPLTPGYTYFWESDIQYFEQGQYDNPPEHGKPGLNFDMTNLQAIHEELKIGLGKRELQYYRNGKLIKSIIEFNDEWEWTPYTARFNKKGCLYSLLGKREMDSDFEIKTIEIENIFAKNSKQQKI